MPTAPPVHRSAGWKPHVPYANSRTAAKRITGRTLQTRNDRIKLRDQYTCKGCGMVTPPRYLQVDHVKPLAEGGTEDDSNLQSLCIVGNEGGCHGLKSRREALRGAHGHGGEVKIPGARVT